jgi:hypothetical protein
VAPGPTGLEAGSPSAVTASTVISVSPDFTAFSGSPRCHETRAANDWCIYQTATEICYFLGYQAAFRDTNVAILCQIAARQLARLYHIAPGRSIASNYGRQTEHVAPRLLQVGGTGVRAEISPPEPLPRRWRGCAALPGEPPAARPGSRYTASFKSLAGGTP